jgi:hypothetical protein
MQMNNIATRQSVTKRSNGKHHPIVLGRGIGRRTDAVGFQRALEALGAAYAQVASMLDQAIESTDSGLGQLAALGANYAWISERRQLVKTFLESEPAILAYAHIDCPAPDQIQSLAETATELAGKHETLPSALGLLNYIDLELGWADGEGRFAVD